MKYLDYFTAAAGAFNTAVSLAVGNTLAALGWTVVAVLALRIATKP